MGGVCDSSNPSTFNLLFYERPPFCRSTKFDFQLEIHYEDFNPKELETMLNKKVSEENAIFRACLTKFDEKDFYSEQNPRVYCHILIFEVRRDDDKLYMVSQNQKELRRDAERTIAEFLY